MFDFHTPFLMRQLLREYYAYLKPTIAQMNKLVLLNDSLEHRRYRYSYIERDELTHQLLQKILRENQLKEYKKRHKISLGHHIHEEKFEDEVNMEHTVFLKDLLLYIRERYQPRVHQLRHEIAKQKIDSFQNEIRNIKISYSKYINKKIHSFQQVHQTRYSLYRPYRYQQFLLEVEVCKIIPERVLLKRYGTGYINQKIATTFECLPPDYKTLYQAFDHIYTQMIHYYKYLLEKHHIYEASNLLKPPIDHKDGSETEKKFALFVQYPECWK